MKYFLVLVAVLTLTFFYLKGKDAFPRFVYETRKGDGNVIMQERMVGSFKRVSSASALEMILEKGDVPKVVVEIDSNLQDLIQTNVKNGELAVRVKGNIRNATKMKVYVTYVELSELRASSASSITTVSLIEADELSVECSSAAKIKLKVVANRLKCTVSSAAKIELAGNTTVLDASSSSAGNLKLFELESDTTYVDASSGAGAKVVANKYLKANASSGGGIEYKGAPIHPKINTSSGGSVRQK